MLLELVWVDVGEVGWSGGEWMMFMCVEICVVVGVGELLGVIGELFYDVFVCFVGFEEVMVWLCMMVLSRIGVFGVRFFFIFCSALHSSFVLVR